MLMKKVWPPELRIQEELDNLKLLKTRRQRINLVSAVILMIVMDHLMMMRFSKLKKAKREEEKLEQKKDQLQEEKAQRKRSWERGQEKMIMVMS